MRHRVLFDLPKPKVCAALGADGWTKGQRLHRQEEYPGTAESSEKDGGLKPNWNWFNMDENFDINEEDMLPILVNGLMNWIKLCRYLWTKILSWGMDRGGEEEELDNLLLLPLEDKDFLSLT